MATRQGALVHATIDELATAYTANDLATWKQVRSHVDRAIVQATSRFEQTHAQLSDADPEAVATFEQARNDLARDVARVDIAEPPKGYAQVAREQELLGSLRAPSVAGFTGRRDAVHAELEQLAIADLRVLRARIASPQPQDELAAEIWKLGPTLRGEVATFIETVDRRKARERAAAARPQPAPIAPAPDTIETKLRAALEGPAMEPDMFAAIATLDGTARRALGNRLRSYRPGNGDDIGARFLRLDAVVRERILMELAREKPATPARPEPMREAWSTVEGMLEILRDKKRPGVVGSGRYSTSLDALYAATNATSKLTPSQRLEQFGQALADLDPAIKLYETSEEGRVWVEEQLRAEMVATRSALAFGAAKDRVDRSVFVYGKLVEMPDDAHPHEQASVLRKILPKLIDTMKLLSEQALRANFSAVHHEMEHLLEGHGEKGGLSRLLELQRILMLADGWLKLSDDELQHHLHEIQGVLNGVASYSELVAAVIEVTGAGTLLAVSFAGALARLAGDKALTATVLGFTGQMTHKLGNLVVIVESIHSASVLFDSHASRQERVDAGANLVTAGAWFAGKQLAGPTTGFVASTNIYLGYLELKAVAYLFWQGNLGLTTGFMKEAFATLIRDGEALASAARDVTACQGLLAQEREPQQQAALKRVAESMVTTLGRTLDSLLDDCGNIPLSAGMAKQPGTQRILRETFEPLMKYRGVRDPALLAEGAGLALERITWIGQNATTIIVASAHQEHLEDVEAELQKAKEAADAE